MGLAGGRCGGGEGTGSRIYLTMGTGRGAGLIRDGDVYRGASDQAGEVGHMPVVPGGGRCNCGQRGCLEAYTGGAALTANLEAARELPRQLRLRGLGGQVIVDFAPLRKSDRKRIEEALKTAFRRDPIETTLAGWTPLGNFELQRKRERRPLSELLP